MTHNYIIRNLAFALAFLMTGISACKKDSLETKSDPETVGVYVLHEGTWNMRNSGIDFYDVKTNMVIADYFKKVNGYDLGESAVQLKQYGNKIYCVVSGTDGAAESFLEVLDPSSLKSIKRIPFFKGTDIYLPRSIAFSGSKAYVTGFDGYIRRVDTASLVIDKEIKAGGTLEGLAIANGKLYAANSDRFWSGKGSTVSIVDLDSFTLLKEIEVGPNPTQLETAPDGNVFVTVPGIARDNFSLKKINTKTDIVMTSHKIEMSLFAIAGNTGYAVVGPWGERIVKSFNTATGLIGNNFITSTTAITNPYGLTVNSLNGDVLIADTGDPGDSNGMAYCFKPDGTLAYKFETGQSPQQAVFVYK
jgi:hypothetical protein